MFVDLWSSRFATFLHIRTDSDRHNEYACIAKFPLPHQRCILRSSLILRALHAQARDSSGLACVGWPLLARQTCLTVRLVIHVFDPIHACVQQGEACSWLFGCWPYGRSSVQLRICTRRGDDNQDCSVVAPSGAGCNARSGDPHVLRLAAACLHVGARRHIKLENCCPLGSTVMRLCGASGPVIKTERNASGLAAATGAEASSAKAADRARDTGRVGCRASCMVGARNRWLGAASFLCELFESATGGGGLGATPFMDLPGLL